jgi:hypothetical protein
VNGTPNWGVPHWVRSEEYPQPTGNGEMIIWAWEFLRRNHGYRTFWKLNIEPFIDPDTRRISSNRDGQIWPYHDEVKSRFGVDIPSPRKARSHLIS